MDKLFEDDVGFKGITYGEDGSIDFSLFMISPHRAMWERLWASLCHNGNCKWNFITTCENENEVFEEEEKNCAITGF